MGRTITIIDDDISIVGKPATCEFCNDGHPGNWKMTCNTCGTKYVICADCNVRSAGKQSRNYCRICNRNQKIATLTNED